jgi:fructose-bisphosphate aldolase, class I
VAVDHFIGYGQGLPRGLREMKKTLAEIAAGEPDAVTMQKGIAMSAWAPFAGRIPLILQDVIGRLDDVVYEELITPEEALRLGADAIAVAAFVRGKTEGVYLRVVSNMVREAARFDLPVICHIYPRSAESDFTRNTYEPDEIAWAVHCALELGVDVIKTPYCGDRAAYAQIIADSPVPVVAAGGPQQDTLEAALGMMADAVAAGARGATIGRNIWGSGRTTQALKAFKAVIHDCKSPQEALEAIA